MITIILALGVLALSYYWFPIEDKQDKPNN
ncbi:Uncharacterised protein [Campylobacter hyointestinalis subsp. hyointestinalis]|uniref:Uncharacterized protein n=1 Tax=Campylobacter hyointestinalis subsp. hyointestinalis TaxID=91352 RepID=A0A0S4SV82_CAMHY|nr:Uncharacterised protein [Campylobacter hyointestinalis subsp. hyointestinalis]